MQSNCYTRRNLDGSITTVDGPYILDHINTAILEAKAYAAVLANQDPATPQITPYALQLNREHVEQICDLLSYVARFARFPKP